MKNEMIKTENLTKTYRRFKKKEGLWGSFAGLWSREYEEKTAVENLTLSIDQGEFVGLIGPNGAGKTTFIKMLTGIIEPSEGQIQVLGYRPGQRKNEFKKKYAVVMGQKSQLFFELTLNDTLRLFKEIYEIPEKEYQESKGYFTELFGVQNLMDVQVRTLSLGERMKMELIVALLHNPQVLFLDEPTIGLDAVAAKQIRRFLKEINEERGTTILLTSHYMEDIKQLCRRTVVLNHGRKIFDGNTEELFEKYQQNKRITVTFSRPTQIAPEELWKIGAKSVEKKLEGTAAMKAGITVLEDSPYKKVYEVHKEWAKELLELLMQYEPTDVSAEEEEIGTVVERIYRSEAEFEAVMKKKRQAKDEEPMSNDKNRKGGTRHA